VDARRRPDRPLPRRYHAVACEALDRRPQVHPSDMRVPLRRRQVRMARERLHRRRRDSPSEERGDEVGAKVVQTKGFDTGANARRPDEGPTRATAFPAPFASR
jgi:hypothetical protein